MRGRYESSADLAQKVDSEGGICEMLYGYGLSYDELPDDMPDSIKTHIYELLGMQHQVEAVESYLDQALTAYYKQQGF